MRGMRRRAAFALLLLSLCVPAMHVSAEAGGGQAEYTVEYIARDQGAETLLARETYRAPAGRRVNVPHRDFDHCKKEPGQDMTTTVDITVITHAGTNIVFTCPHEAARPAAAGINISGMISIKN